MDDAAMITSRGHAIYFGLHCAALQDAGQPPSSITDPLRQGTGPVRHYRSFGAAAADKALAADQRQPFRRLLHSGQSLSCFFPL